jgi:hypothetical protein
VIIQTERKIFEKEKKGLHGASTQGEKTQSKTRALNGLVIATRGNIKGSLMA